MTGMPSRLMRLRLSSNPSPPHHSTPATWGSPENSWYARTPLVSSCPASRSTSSTFRPPTPPVEFTSRTAASRELWVMVPTKAPMPEKGDTTPTLIVSLAPPRRLDPPLEQAARTGAEAAPSPATIPHRNTWRRDTSGGTAARVRGLGGVEEDRQLARRVEHQPVDVGILGGGVEAEVRQAIEEAGEGGGGRHAGQVDGMARSRVGAVRGEQDG